MSVRGTPVHALLALLLLTAALLSTLGPATAATSSTVVGATVPSATYLDASGCRSATAGVTSFGAVPVNASMVTTSDCLLKFSSSNDSSAIRIYQADAGGRGMHSLGTGAFDLAFDGAGGANGQVVDTSLAVSGDIHAADAIPGRGYVMAGRWGGATSVIAVYTTGGLLDTSFNGTGYLTTAPFAFATGVVAQPDGRIVAVGSLGGNVVVGRWTSTGLLDTSFDGDGLRTIDLGGAEAGSCVALNSAGRIIVGGDNGTDAFAVRLRSDGAIDTSFNGGAPRMLDAGLGDKLYHCIVDRDDRPVLIGRAQAATVDMSVYRLTTAGALDPAFNTTGIRTIDFYGNEEYGYEVAQDEKGRYVAVGNVREMATGRYLGAARLLDDGNLDPSFVGTSGPGPGRIRMPSSLSSAVIDDYYVSVLSPGDGRLMLSASTWISADGAYRSRVYRLLESGAPDTSFNATGEILLTNTEQTYATKLLPGVDGDVVLVGDADQLTTWSSAAVLTSFDGGTTIPDYNDVGGDDWATPGASLFGACLSSVAGAGVSASWTASAGCPASDGTHWRAIPVASSPAATVATTAGASAAPVEARLRFGMRTLSTQAVGTYVAPIAIEVLAPAA